ncbi:MAG: putative glycolipid-binding domain-containing protein, partial [Mycobacterium sp.]
DLSVSSAPVSYRSTAAGAAEGIQVHSPVSDTTVTVDADGFIVDYPGLAERI